MDTTKRLPTGDYRIQFVGAHTPEYATSNGLQKAVTVAPGTPPSVVERQIWRVLQRGPAYVIEAEKHLNDRWYYSEPGKHQPITLKHEAKEFLIESANDPGHPNVYFIKPVPLPHHPIGVDYLVDAEGKDVVIKSYPVVPGPRPKWQFTHWVHKAQETQETPE